MRLRLFSRLGMRFSAVLAITVLCAVLVLALVAMRQLRLFGEYAVEQNRAHLVAQAEDYIADKTLERALHLRAVFRQAEVQVSALAGRVTQVLDDREFYARKNFNPGESYYLEQKNSVFSNRRDSLASSVYWGAHELGEDAEKDITALSHVDPLLKQIKKSVPGAAASWFITKNAIARYYPNIHHVDFMPPVESFDYRDDLCYLIATPEQNPERGVVWHEVYLDSMGQGLVVTVSAPSYSQKGEFLASAGIDISLDGILEGAVLSDSTKGSRRFSFVVDEAGRLIAFPRQQLELFDINIIDDQVAVSPTTLLRYSLQDSSNPAVHAMAGQLLVGQPGNTRVMLDGEEYLLVFQPMGAMGWTLGHVVPMQDILASVERTREAISTSRDAIASRYGLIALAVLACSLFASLLFINFSLFTPLGAITKTVRRVSRGDFSARADLHRDDELGDLAGAVDDMAMQLEQQRNELLDARETYRGLFDGAMSGLYRSTPEGKLISANQSFAAMFGYDSPEQLVSKISDTKMQLYADPKERDLLVEEVLRKGEVKGFETRMKRKDGTVFWANANVRLDRSEDGEPMYFEGSVVDVTDRKLAEEYRGMLSRELIRIQETERRRLATDLHDNLAQELSALKIAFEMLLEDQPATTDATQQQADRCTEMLQRSIAGVRGMAQGLGPFGLEQLGLEGMLREYCARFSETSEIEVDFYVAGLGGTGLSAEAMAHVFRIIQEALNNVQKHSEAGHVKVRVVSSHPNIIVRVEDDGKGFDPNAVPVPTGLDDVRMGLMSIRERARLLNGTASIDSITGKGTRILVEIPLNGKSD